VKYAFMTFSTPDLSLGDALATAKRFGYDGLELRIDADHRHGVERSGSPEERAAAGEQAERSGVELCCVATSCRFADPETAADAVETARSAIDLAADIGCPRIRVFGGKIPEGGSREASADLIVESLKSLVAQATERGVTVCIETHDDWCDPGHIGGIVERVDDPAVGANWDIMHPIRVGSSMDAAFEALRPWIRHVHFHDGEIAGGKTELKPIGEGVIDHKRAVQRLVESGYDGFLSGEWIKWQPAEEHLPRELATMKRYEQERGG
jgi:sugar phosphate isomerase/epimerase